MKNMYLNNTYIGKPHEIIMGLCICGAISMAFLAIISVSLSAMGLI